ncbi:hypothetical protein JK628_11770 [Shewanella sp. KX20019]|uniref:hypothetical protein n=1 Tax=Shewanella sp. KX20019 TaxID=2803864 RepID=UPI0019273C86|nr:hypothetical protein [Shewanella sp. KX20019]QQX78293.1 hypothetical protein JK628_11770 [Shewanella sp. KX20019]
MSLSKLVTRLFYPICVYAITIHFCSLNTLPAESSVTLAKSRYSAGLVCQDKGWEFCARWAKSKRSPGSRIA